MNFREILIKKFNFRAEDAEKIAATAERNVVRERGSVKPSPFRETLALRAAITEFRKERGDAFPGDGFPER